LPCAEHAAAVSDRLDTSEVDIVLVTFARAAELDEYQLRRGLPLPILIDAERRVYSAYGLGRASFFDVWGRATARRYLTILRSSGPGSGLRDLKAATADTRQLGGDFVVAPDGRLAWGYWSAGPADRPSTDEIVEAVRAASGSDD
jgi:AhpC/TSA antioxidant enzyme